MHEAIEKLLILQDRDRKISQVRDELTRIPAERLQLQAKTASTQTALDAAKHQVKHLESERKKLELDVEAKKQLIEKYSLQQFQTKKNEEYRALAHEIEMCKEAITVLDDGQIEFMEQIEAAQTEVTTATKAAAEAKHNVDSRVGDLAARELNLQKDLATLDADREALAAAVEESVRERYERLLKHRGQNIVVGVQHAVCGGCHMQLSRQVIVSCQARQELVTCPNCGRILFCTPDMDLAVAD